MAEPKAPKQPAAPATSDSKAVSRREFLMYAWGISLGVLAAGAGIATVAFALPRFKEGEFGGTFTIDPASLPPVNSPPQANSSGKYWLAHLETGILAHYRVCTHLGCLYEWDSLNFRFQCPCHGSRFWFDGELMRGPAARGLDEFVIQAQDAAGTVLAETQDPGVPVPVPEGTATIIIDTGQRVIRSSITPIPPGEQPAPYPGGPPITPT